MYLVREFSICGPAPKVISYHHYANAHMHSQIFTLPHMNDSKPYFTIYE
jgi:hypothetical protein